MAQKKHMSQAEQAVSASNKKKKTAEEKKTAEKKSTEKKTADKKTDQQPEEKAERKIPVRFISSCIFLIAFVLFLVIFFVPEGALVGLIKDLVLGLIGKVGFLISIPCFLYLFIIHAFSGKRPVIMRSVCLGVFILLCGCFSHLILKPEHLRSGVDLIADLYTGGIAGQTAGLICGGITMFFTWLLHDILTGIALVIGAILTLLGSMQITIPSIIRAVRNRPRADWEGEQEEKQEPAAVLVNHIANKRIEKAEMRRIKAEEEAARAAEEAEMEERERARRSHKQTLSERIDIEVDDVPEALESAASYQADAPLFPESAPESSEKTDFFTEADMVFPSGEEIPLPGVSDAVEAFEALKEPEKPAPKQVVKPKKVSAKEAEASAVEVAEEILRNETEEKPEYCFPPIDLLKLPDSGFADGTAEMRENSKRLNETLASFKIDARITSVTRGPSVTRYEIELEKGVRLGKVTSAADDIALSLGASGVRIAAVPGKISIVGIEVPNKSVNTVSLREVIDSQEFNKAKSKSSFAVGKDIGGNCIVGNIAKLPHMLIAGTTGSGKSVCMNSIIISLLYKASPDDVKLIMVDPKMVELGIYNGIPHLLIPVVTDPKKAAGSLQWAVTEMMRRYKIMSDMGVRDIESYNSIIVHEEDGKKLPQVVVIIDELADLMIVAAKEVEESICRIAQMGRASGIHLLIATQRPSADVITGLMKANIPSRIAFAVASAMESRIILDTQGAEKLVGKGDMLYAPIGCGKPLRVQGCFVSDPEVEAVATYVKSHFNTDYDQEVLEEIERKAVNGEEAKPSGKPAPSSDEMACDEMLPAAVDVFMETGQASVSMLQRRLKLGYARAARIVDEMEELGLVGKYQGSKPREMLVTKDQWESMKEQGNFQLNFQDYIDDQSGEED